MQHEREHYQVICRLDGRTRVLLWYCGETDGVVVDDAGDVVSFECIDSAVGYAQNSGLLLAREQPVVYDFDQLQASLTQLEHAVDCRALLNFWNLFVDVAASVSYGETFREQDQAASSIYDKLFFGTNLPAMTPPGCRYEPMWTAGELTEVSAVLLAGIELVRAALGEAA